MGERTSTEILDHIWSIEITKKWNGEPVDHFVCKDQRRSVELAVERTSMFSERTGRECEWIQRYVPVYA